VEIVIRVALIFFLIQFVVVLTLMIVALLLTRPEVPMWGRMPGHDAFRRSFRFVIHLPCRALCCLARWVRGMHSLYRAH
jgi:hypothetical protein